MTPARTLLLGMVWVVASSFLGASAFLAPMSTRPTTSLEAHKKVKKAKWEKHGRGNYPVRVGDTVYVNSGDDKGETGIIKRIYRGRCIVEGLNMRTKHKKPQQGGAAGGIIQMEGFMHLSNVNLIDPESKLPTRVRYKQDPDNDKNKLRISKRSEQTCAAPVKVPKEKKPSAA